MTTRALFVLQCAISAGFAGGSVIVGTDIERGAFIGVAVFTALLSMDMRTGQR